VITLRDLRLDDVKALRLGRRRYTRPAGARRGDAVRGLREERIGAGADALAVIALETRRVLRVTHPALGVVGRGEGVAHCVYDGAATEPAVGLDEREMR